MAYALNVIIFSPIVAGHPSFWYADAVSTIQTDSVKYAITSNKSYMNFSSKLRSSPQLVPITFMSMFMEESMFQLTQLAVQWSHSFIPSPGSLEL
jgi:hypothetical protein